MPTNNQPTVISSWLKIITEMFKDTGCYQDNLCRDAGIDENDLLDDAKRIDILKAFKLWDEIIKRSNNKLIGLRMGGIFNIEHLGTVGYSILASDSIKEAILRMHRYNSILCDGITYEIEEVDEGYKVYCKTPKGVDHLALHVSIDSLMSSTISTIRWISCQKVTPIKLCLNHSAYAEESEYQKQLQLECPIEFNTEDSYLLYKKSDIEASLATSNKMILDLYDQINAKALQQIGRDQPKKQLSQQVRDLLVEQLPNGEPPIDSMAKVFNMSLRTFQRRLKDDGWTFLKLLDETRKVLAVHHLCDNKFSLQETTFLLGFSDASIFSRAFKRWYGSTPAKYITQAESQLLSVG